MTHTHGSRAPTSASMARTILTLALLVATGLLLARTGDAARIQRLLSIRPLPVAILTHVHPTLSATPFRECPPVSTVSLVSERLSPACGLENERCQNMTQVSLTNRRKAVLVPAHDRIIAFTIDCSTTSSMVSFPANWAAFPARRSTWTESSTSRVTTTLKTPSVSCNSA